MILRVLIVVFGLSNDCILKCLRKIVVKINKLEFVFE